MIQRILKNYGQSSEWIASVAVKTPNGAKLKNGNWVVPIEMGNELGNKKVAEEVPRRKL